MRRAKTTERFNFLYMLGYVGLPGDNHILYGRNGHKEVSIPRFRG